MRGSSFFYDKNSKDYSVSILSQIKHYVKESTLLLLDDLDFIYGALYDLFNQRFASKKDSRYCNVVYEDFKESLSINLKFKCIIFKSQINFINQSNFEEKLPSPLMNRFEKHLFNFNLLPNFGKIFYFD